jgi:hypothetical protein
MKLATLKTKLKVLTGTTIGEVLFDWQTEINTARSKTYPYVFWSFDSMDFTNDIRSSNIQIEKVFKATAFVMGLYRADTQDKITIWDTLEAAMNVYLNALNARDTTLQVFSINEIKGEYLPESQIQADNVIGIAYRDIIIKTYCST